MVKVSYEPSEVLISLREPYNKNTVWIHPLPDNIQVKVYDNGWKILSETKDIGLTAKALEQVSQLHTLLKDFLLELILKLFGKFSSNGIVINEKYKKLEERVAVLEDKIEKINKKYSRYGQ